jgi:chromosome segregation ATPase
VSPLLQNLSACRVTGDTTLLTNTKKAIMAGGFKSKNQRAVERRAARELARDADMSLASSNPRTRVGWRERGGRAIALRSGAITNSSCADHVRARVREATAVQNLQSQVSKLRKQVSSGEEAERHWRVLVDSQKDAEKDLRSQLSAADRERVEAEIKRREVEKEVSRLKGKTKAMFEADRGDATEELNSSRWWSLRYGGQQRRRRRGTAASQVAAARKTQRVVVQTPTCSYARDSAKVCRT